MDISDINLKIQALNGRQIRAHRVPGSEEWGLIPGEMAALIGIVDRAKVEAQEEAERRVLEAQQEAERRVLEAPDPGAIEAAGAGGPLERPGDIEPKVSTIPHPPTVQRLEAVIRVGQRPDDQLIAISAADVPGLVELFRKDRPF